MTTSTKPQNKIFALVGAGIVIEKGFQGGGNALRESGVRIESLAYIESMDDGIIVFG